MRNNHRLIFLLLLYATPSFLLAQNSGMEKVDGMFTKMKAIDFFNALETKLPYTFYYDETKLDSVFIDLSVNNKTLNDVLKEAFTGTDVNFAINGKSIFITRKLPVITKLPEGLFDGENGKQNMAGQLIDYGIESKKVNKISGGKIIQIGKKSNNRTPVVLNGYIRNSKTGEPVSNATLFTDDNKETVTTDAYGFYQITLPPGGNQLHIQQIAMKDMLLNLAIYADGKLDVDMDEQVRVLKEVIVSGSKKSNIRSVEMGLERLGISDIKKVPSVFGEADVLRVVVSLPGVKTVGEASTGFNVRGGSADQNLILFNDNVIYNPSHFFGMFSAFNPEVIKDIELYKSSIPANYGGRLSSVLDISGREGNKKKITGSAGIGPVTSRINIEGPLVKGRTSFIFGARTTYANWLLKLLPEEYKNSKANFQDINLLLNHRIDSNNNLFFSGYFSNDRFSLGGDTTYGYSNRNASIKWKHNFSNKLNSTVIVGYDKYQYDITSKENKVNAFKLGFDIRQLNFKADFSYYRNSKHSFDFGLSTISYKLNPGYFKPAVSESQVVMDKVQTEQALESGVYFAHKFNVNTKLTFNTGIRYSLFNYLGPQQVSTYAPGQPLTQSNRTGTVNYDKGKFIKTYNGPELRFSTRYAFTGDFSIKLAYNTLRQYIHLLSNSTIISPTDIWKLSDPNIKPQFGYQASFGIYKNFSHNTIETSIEVYYKGIRDYLDYKPGATLFLNHNIETDVISTKGKAYGLEVLLKKTSGKLNGWISYTYSRILLLANDASQGVIINNGNFYPANYDKPHDATLAGNFKVNHRFSISLNTTYSTGRPITVPVGRYFYAGSERVLYSDRNAYRIPDYIRADFSLNIDGNHKVNQKTHNSWTIGVYNVLGRRNPYSVYFVSENGRVNGYKLSIFGSAIPFVNFNIRF